MTGGMKKVLKDRDKVLTDFGFAASHQPTCLDTDSNAEPDLNVALQDAK